MGSVQQMQSTVTTMISEGVWQNIVFSLLVVALLLVTHQLTARVLARRVADPARLYHLKHVAGYLAATVGLVWVGWIWFHTGLAPLAEFLALIGAGLIIALHDTIANLTGWIFIVWRRPFQVGDRVEIDGRIGDVVDLRLFQFSIVEVGGERVGGEQSTGRILHIPNGKVMREILSNYEIAFPYIWDEVPIQVTFESNWREAKAILTRVCDKLAKPHAEEAAKKTKEATRRYLLHTGTLTPIVYCSIGDSGVKLALRYVVPPRARRNLQQEICEEILTEFGHRSDIDFAYPTLRYYHRGLEDPAAGPGAALPPRGGGEK